MGSTENTHGGAREGAGREALHPEGKTAKATVTVPAALLKGADKWAKKNGVTRSQAFAEGLRRLMDG